MENEIEFKEKEIIDSDSLNLQNFLTDMHNLGLQTKDKDLVKPVFQYGTLEITNYLLWLMIGELKILNQGAK